MNDECALDRHRLRRHTTTTTLTRDDDDVVRVPDPEREG